ncbi:calcium channel [Coprinopsis cinerea okayama7|uniref:Calcium channel n=1 Tax=Coprinopsis cinerea (strain Okayama-7 / 130 / ATCC MYA-4618 / FGSC 9003) TaxID=240176 RepID=A8N7G8_COPC7|nr:calcium channel [Coprinopsis cinerea okayama7\|eukprot:XP_001830774.2 calcium channel [Coprinopsis cinerea okayama7\
MKLSNILPTTLLCLLDAILVSAQPRRELPLDVVVPGTALNGQAFVIPTAGSLVLSVAVCSENSNLRFIVSNSSSTSNPNSDGGALVNLVNGVGTYVSGYPNGGVLQIEGSGSFEVALSDTGQPIHAHFPPLPLLGDTTSNQAILFSPPFFVPEPIQPRYPNYTMLPVDIPQDSPPQTPDYTLSLFPTREDDYPRSSCFLSAESQLESGTITSEETPWLRDEDGWRLQYLIRGLEPSTNYTAYVLDDTRVFGPIYFTTKSAAFPCHLVSNLPYCPRVAYAMPLAPPPDGADTYTGDTLPQELQDPLKSYLTNFTISLGRFACGRDLYSPLVDCIDCQREYRKWLCAISLPRCSEPSPSNPNAFTALAPDPTATGLSATKNEQQQVLSALVPLQTSTPPRNSNLPPFDSPYQMLLPCLETCTAVDRACPPFLGFKCPTSQFNGAASYGIGYIDGKEGDEKEGLTGQAQDRYGNVWCALG